ncbi:MAG: RDD family protein [Oscillospiraceae bacterium]|nr:RDD family protein [Oscillospiraceae bacterium]
MRNNYAGFAVRLAAWLIDALVTFVPLSILRSIRFALAVSNPYAGLVSPVLFRYSSLDILIYLLPVVYFIAMTLSGGATVGKMVMRIKVVSADGDSLSFWQVLMRELVGRYLSLTLLCIGYFMIVPDSQKRALHDRIADTRVIYAIPQTVTAYAAPYDE